MYYVANSLSFGAKTIAKKKFQKNLHNCLQNTRSNKILPKCEKNLGVMTNVFGI